MSAKIRSTFLMLTINIVTIAVVKSWNDILQLEADPKINEEDVTANRPEGRNAFRILGYW